MTAFSEQPKDRLLWLDGARGLAILMMVVFHFFYDLSHFHFMALDFTDPFWRGFRTLILSLFFVVSGWTMTLNPAGGLRWGSFIKRFGQVAAAALALSLVTYLLFPQQWIYFGILHFFALSMWLALPFRQRPWLALCVGAALFFLDATVDGFGTTFLFLWLQPWLNLPNSTLDIARLVPWFGVVLFGIFLGHLGRGKLAIPVIVALSGLATHSTLANHALNAVAKPLAWVGKHPLFIYLVHQPILFGLIALAANIAA